MESARINQYSEAEPPDLPAPIVEPDWLARNLRNPALRIIDLRERPDYGVGHLPGAVWFDRTALSLTRPDHSVILIPAALFAVHMSRLGISGHSRVVVYDDVWGMHAARLVWACRRYGHSGAAVLSGGAEGWQQCGGALTQGRLLTYPRPFQAGADDAQRADLWWLQARAMDRQLLLLDVRGAHEYAAGHLPGARHWEWSRGTPVGSRAMLRPADELRAELIRQGITPDKRIVTYCSSGSRAAHTYLLLRSLGYPDVRVLDDAWRAWAQVG